MLRRLQPYAFVAALGMLLHLGLAGASVWCKAMGLLPASCCPEEGHAVIQAPSDCCRAALETPELGLGETSFQVDAGWDALPWERPAELVASHRAMPVEPTPTATPPPIPLLSTIVLLC